MSPLIAAGIALTALLALIALLQHAIRTALDKDDQP